MLLAVATHDVYQEIQKDASGTTLNWQSIDSLAEAKAAELGKEYWLECWLYNGSAWEGPELLMDLLARKREEIVTNFTPQSWEYHFCDIMGHNGILWTIFDGEVNAILPTGDILSHKIPTPEDAFASFPKANLLALPGKGVCLAHNERLWSLNILGQTLVVEEMAGGTFPANASDFIVSLSGELFMSGNEYGGSMRTWTYTGDSWKLREELGDFLTVDHSGNIWFFPGRADTNFKYFAKGYTIITEQGLERLRLRGIKWVGEVSSVGEGVMLAACGNAILHIAHDGNRWGVDKVSLLSPESTYLVHKAFLDSRGRIFFGNIWAYPCP